VALLLGVNMSFTFQGYISSDSEIICEVCDHDGCEPYTSQETDSPCNCAYCHRPIECELTNDGIKYVYEAIRQALKEGLNTRSDWRWDYGYYDQMGVHASLRDHAEQLLDHNPEKKIKRVVEYYLYHTRNMP
jgi:hypothetical protein